MPPVSQLVVFAHGMESGPWGTKIKALARVAEAAGWAVDSRDYRSTKDPDARVRMLLADPPQAEKLVLVGSSMGGYVSAMACEALNPDGLLLIAPALYFERYDAEPTGIPKHCSVVHGWHDDIVPPERAIRFADTHKAELHMLDGDHRLVEQIPELIWVLERILARIEHEQAND